MAEPAEREVRELAVLLEQLVGPNTLGELAGRIRSVLRRSTGERIATGEPAAQAPASGDLGSKLRIDPGTREVELDGTPVPVTARKFDPLTFLAAHPRHVFARAQLLEQVRSSSGAWHEPTARERHLVERLTQLASVAIDHDSLLGALTESEERFRRVFEDTAVGMALATLDGGLTRVNRAMRALLDRSDYDLIGTRLDELFIPQGERIAHGRRDEYESTTHTADGRVLDLAVSVSPIRGIEGTPRALSVNVLEHHG